MHVHPNNSGELVVSNELRSGLSHHASRFKETLRDIFVTLNWLLLVYPHTNHTHTHEQRNAEVEPVPPKQFRFNLFTITRFRVITDSVKSGLLHHHASKFRKFCATFFGKLNRLLLVLYIHIHRTTHTRHEQRNAEVIRGNAPSMAESRRTSSGPGTVPGPRKTSRQAWKRRWTAAAAAASACTRRSLLPRRLTPAGAGAGWSAATRRLLAVRCPAATTVAAAGSATTSTPPWPATTFIDQSTAGRRANKLRR